MPLKHLLQILPVNVPLLNQTEHSLLITTINTENSDPKSFILLKRLYERTARTWSIGRIFNAATLKALNLEVKGSEDTQLGLLEKLKEIGLLENSSVKEKLEDRLKGLPDAKLRKIASFFRVKIPAKSDSTRIVKAILAPMKTKSISSFFGVKKAKIDKSDKNEVNSTMKNDKTEKTAETKKTETKFKTEDNKENLTKPMKPEKLEKPSISKENLSYKIKLTKKLDELAPEIYEINLELCNLFDKLILLNCFTRFHSSSSIRKSLSDFVGENYLKYPEIETVDPKNCIWSLGKSEFLLYYEVEKLVDKYTNHQSLLTEKFEDLVQMRQKIKNLESSNFKNNEMANKHPQTRYSFAPKSSYSKLISLISEQLEKHPDRCVTFITDHMFEPRLSGGITDRLHRMYKKLDKFEQAGLIFVDFLKQKSDKNPYEDRWLYEISIKYQNYQSKYQKLADKNHKKAEKIKSSQKELLEIPEIVKDVILPDISSIQVFGKDYVEKIKFTGEVLELKAKNFETEGNRRAFQYGKSVVDVETFAKLYLKDNSTVSENGIAHNFDYVVYAENNFLSTVLILVGYDFVYESNVNKFEEKVDVWYSNRQKYPLDFMSESFVKNRSDKRWEEMFATLTENEIINNFEKASKYDGLLDKEIANEDTIKVLAINLARCRNDIQNLLELRMKFNCLNAGFADLVGFTACGECILLEVKSESDSLRTKQLFWWEKYGKFVVVRVLDK